MFDVAGTVVERDGWYAATVLLLSAMLLMAVFIHDESIVVDAAVIL